MAALPVESDLSTEKNVTELNRGEKLDGISERDTKHQDDAIEVNISTEIKVVSGESTPYMPTIPHDQRALYGL